MIDLDRFSSYNQVISVTARIMAICKDGEKPSLSQIMKLPALSDMQKAEIALIKMAQANITDIDIQDRYKRFGAYRRRDVIVVVGGRLESRMKATHNNQQIVLLPHDHRLKHLYIEFAHASISATAYKVRLKFWIVKLEKIVRSVGFNCIVCRKMTKKRC